MRKDDVVFEAEVDRAVEERGIDGRRGRIVRIVEPQQTGAARDFVGNRRKVRNEPIFFLERKEIRLAAVENASRIIDRIARVRNQHDIARIDHGGGEVGDSFLRTDECADLARGVEAMAEAALEPSGGSAAIFLEAFVVGIAMIFGKVSRPLEALHNMLWCAEVGVTDSETDHIDALGCDFLL